MPLVVNLRHLEKNNVHLQGELPVEELDLDIHDEMIRAEAPLVHDIEVQQMDHNLLLRGSLRLKLHCQCVRCLKPFEQELKLEDWTRLLPLQGDDKASVENDCVDLTPYVREDILLEFPQHPLCEADCCGLPNSSVGKANKAGTRNQDDSKSSAWSELDKLKF